MIMIIGTLIPTIAAKGNNSSQTAIEQDGLRLESTNAVGKVLAKAASEQTAQQSGDYGIIDVEIAGNIVNVQINNEESCTVVVAVYDDDTGRMIGSGFCDAEKDADIVDVELNVSEVPEYYLLRVFLIDSQKAALCEEYRYIEHTHNFIDAKSKTVDDFPDNVVLNLDESKTNNFAVVADEGIEITTDGVKNILASSENDVYTFNNIDSQFDSLKVGDVISYTDGEQNSIVIKISSVKIQGNTAVIGSDADATIDELFSFLKIDNEFDGDGDKMSVDMTGVEEGIVYEGMEKFDEEQQSPAKAPQKSKVDVSSTLDCPVWKISKKFGYMGDGSGNNTGTATIEFKFEIKVSASYSLKAYYDADWEWKWDFWNSYSSYYFFETVFEFNAKGTGSVTGTLSKEFYLGSITFVTPCGITCGVGFRLVFAASGSISLDLAKLSFKIGFRFDKDSGFKNLSSKPKIELIPTLKSELSVSLSLKVSPSVSLIKVMEVAINPEIGIKVSGTPFSLNPVDKITGKPDESKVHACNVCIDGSIKLFRTVSLTGRFFGKKKSSTLVPSNEWTVSKFYYSISTGKLEFGKTCPNILYCVTFTVVGKDGKALEGASVNIGDGALYKFENGKPVKVGGKVAVTDDKGVAKAYYANGKHTATASKDNSEYSVSFTVMNAEKELKVKLNVVGTGGGTDPDPNPGGDTDPTPTPGILDKLTYEIENGKVTITGCDTSLSGDIVLPSKIEGKPVTSIGFLAFCSSSLTSVTIPDSVTSIDGRAFEDCKSLTSVTIPDSVTSIDNHAFDGCSKLNQINVDTANTAYSSMNGVLFDKDKTELIRYPEGKTDTSYAIPNSVTSIDFRAFEDCKSLTSITIPDSVTSIDGRAFEDCKSLTSITIPNSVTRIGDFAFEGCKKLTQINVDTANTKFSSVNGVLFSKNKAILRRYPEGKADTSYAIPNSVTRIDDLAFSDCRSLTSITIPDGVTSIDDSAFYGCSSLTSVTIPSSVTSIGSAVFSGCDKLTQINVDTANTVYSSENGVLFDKNKTKLIRYPEGKADASYAIPNSVTSIGDWAFENCSSLTSVTIPNSVTSIDWWAFADCSSLTSITIPDSVTSIGDRAFFNCDSLASVYISDIASWCGIAFDDSDSNPLGSGASLYLNGKLVTDLVIPAGVTSIGDYAFYGCSSLTRITIPDSVTSIGRYAFSGCSSLTSVTIPNSVTSIGWRAFWYCSSLTSITIPNSVTSIGGEAFRSCDSLTSVTIGNSVTSIGDDAFSGCSSLTSITIPNSVTRIDDSAFAYCNSLTSITIPSRVTSVGHYAFCGCSSLKDVYYSGTQEQWEKIGIGVYNDYLTNATIHYGSSAPAANARAMRAPAAPAAQNTVYTATAQNAVPGELYMLYAFSSGTDLSSLEYVAQLRAESSEVKFRYIPRNLGDLNVVIVGKFGDSSVQEPVEPEYGVERLELISLPAKTEYDYLSSPIVRLKGLRLKAVYSDGAEKEITDIKSITASKVDTSKLGDQEITLTYEGVSIQITVTVVPRKFKLIWIVDGNQTELTAAEGSKITKPADPELEGYDFMGWSPEVPDIMPAQDLTFTAVFEPIKTKLSIKSPSTTTVSYGFTLNLHANVTDLPEGARVVWSMSGSGFELIPSADGMTCGVKSVSKGSATITAKVVDKNGNAVKDANGNEITASQQLTSKAGFFQKLVAFFKKLFGSNMIIPYALEWIVK